MKRGEELLEILGLTGEIRRVASLAPPPPDLGEGRTSTGLSLSAIAFSVLSSQLQELPLDGPFRVQRYTPFPQVLLVSAQDVPEVRGGSVEFLPDGSVLVAPEGACIVTHGVERSHVLVAERGGVEVFEWKEGAALALPPVAPPSDIGIPPIDSFLLDVEVDSWLMEQALSMSGLAGAFPRVAAAGLVLRLNAPLRVADWRRALNGWQEGSPAPVDRIRGWLRALPTGALDRVEACAMVEVEACRDLILGLTDQLLDGAASSTAPGLVARRDDLESLRRALGLLDRGRDLEVALEKLDRDVAMHMSAIVAAFGSCDDPRLFAVARLEPECWWGSLVSPHA